MREIKFRAWEKSLKQIIPVDNIDFEKRMVNTESVWRMFDEIELMQYTGLKDKNGKEIYEGDILDTDLERLYLVVEFRNGCFVVECRDDNEKYYDIMHPLEKEISNLEYHEVIGNTYENPELLR